MTADGTLITSDRLNDALILTLDRQTAGNALDAALVEALHAALDDAGPISALILTGSGKGFCGGFDLSGLQAETDATLLHRFTRIELLLQRIACFPAPTAAFAHGFAYGAGADLFAACDHRIAAPGCRFSFPGARFGLILGTARLRNRVGAAQAQRLLASRTPIMAEDAGGLVTGLTPRDDWPDKMKTLVHAHPADPRILPDLLHRSRPHDDPDADLAALVRSAARPGLADRLRRYATETRR